jgi:hypothetical protein
MKQACMPGDDTNAPFDILTNLANHEDLLDHVTSFIVPERVIKTHMVVGDDSGWKRDMHVASHGRMIEFEDDEDAATQAGNLYTAQAHGGPLRWMQYDTVHFSGIVSGGMLHLTAPPTNLEVVQLTRQDCISVNTFPEIDRTGNDHTRHLKIYNALMRRGTVFIRNADGAISITLGDLLNNDMENAAIEAEDGEDVTSSSDVREMVRNISMPVEHGAIMETAPHSLSITLEVISRSVILKTRVNTFGRIPVAFRLNSMAMATHADYSPSNNWALLVPEQWMHGNTSATAIDGRNLQVRLKHDFHTVASAIVDNLVISNSLLVSTRIPTISGDDDYHSILDYAKVRRTPEGCRLKVATMRTAACTGAIFARMCCY